MRILRLSWALLPFIGLAGCGGSTGAGHHSVTLAWDPSPSSASKPITYNVFRGTVPGGESSTPVNTLPVSDTHYTDTDVIAGQKYFYVVEAVDAGGASAPTNEVEATVPAP